MRAGVISMIRRFFSWLAHRNDLPVDPFGDPGPGVEHDADLGGHKFAWIANRFS